MTFSGVLVGAVVLVLLAALVNMKAVKALFRFGKAKLGDAGDAVSKLDPMALVRQGIRESRESLSHYREGIAKAEAMASSLRRQVQVNQAEQQRLTNRITVALKNGDPNKTVDQNAVDLDRVETELKTNQTQLELVVADIKAMESDIVKVQDRLHNYEQQAKTAGIKLEVSRQRAELRDFHSSTSNMDALDGKLAEATKAVNGEIDLYNARIDVANRLDGNTAANRSDDELAKQERIAAIKARFSTAQ